MKPDTIITDENVDELPEALAKTWRQVKAGYEQFTGVRPLKLADLQMAHRSIREMSARFYALVDIADDLPTDQGIRLITWAHDFADWMQKWTMELFEHHARHHGEEG